MKRFRLGFLAVSVLGFTWACARDADSPTVVSGVEGPGLTGVLADENGEPLPWVNVMACTRAVCYYNDSAADGRFLFFFDGPVAGLIKTAEDLSAEPRRSSPMVPVTIADDEFLDVGTVHVPLLRAGSPVEPGRTIFEGGDGLVLEFDPASIEVAPGTMWTDVAARRLPDAIVPEYPGVDSDSLVAVYALHPFAATSIEPIAVRFPTDLPEGTRLHMMTIDEIDGSFAETVEVVVEAGAVVTPEGTGITRLTHVVVVRTD